MPDDAPLTEDEAEPLKWRLNKSTPGDLNTGLDGAYATTETSWYAATIRGGKLRGLRWVPLYTASHSPIYTSREEHFRLKFENLHDAQAVCEYHHATGKWEPNAPATRETAAMLSATLPVPGGALHWQRVTRRAMFDRPALIESWPVGDGKGKAYCIGKDYPIFFYFTEDPLLLLDRVRYCYRRYYAAFGTFESDTRYFARMKDAKAACEQHHATGKWN